MAGGGWLVNILIVVIAVLGASHLRVLLEWLLAGGRIHLWQQQQMLPLQQQPAAARIKVRSIPNPRDELRQQMVDDPPGIGMEHFMARMEESLQSESSFWKCWNGAFHWKTFKSRADQ
jgi:hypothetical protein